MNYTPWKAWISYATRRKAGSKCCVAAMHYIVVIWVPPFGEYSARNRLASIFDGMLDLMRCKMIVDNQEARNFVHISHLRSKYLGNRCQNNLAIHSRNLVIAVRLILSAYVNSLHLSVIIFSIPIDCIWHRSINSRFQTIYV